MRWNCPHCKNAITASDEQIPNHWVFSLCPQCLRFGLIKNSTSAAVKADVPPKGDPFIRATHSAPTPVVRSAQIRNPKAVLKAEVTVVQKVESKTVPPRPEGRLPQPLPEVPEKRASRFPRFIYLTCLLALGWNGYRYLKIAQDVVTDRVVQKAMAPVRVELGATVQARIPNAQIRNGPGVQFPVIGALDPEKKYTVISSEDPWYQLQAGTQTPAWVFVEEVSPSN